MTDLAMSEKQLRVLADKDLISTFTELHVLTSGGAPTTCQQLKVKKRSASKDLSSDTVQRELRLLVDAGLALSAPKGHTKDAYSDVVDTSRNWYWVNNPDNWDVADRYNAEWKGSQKVEELTVEDRLTAIEETNARIEQTLETITCTLHA